MMTRERCQLAGWQLSQGTLHEKAFDLFGEQVGVEVLDDTICTQLGHQPPNLTRRRVEVLLLRDHRPGRTVEVVREADEAALFIRQHVTDRDEDEIERPILLEIGEVTFTDLGELTRQLLGGMANDVHLPPLFGVSNHEDWHDFLRVLGGRSGLERAFLS